MPNDHGSSARLTNGSYSVPMGNSGWPSRDQVTPSSLSAPTRLPSAIPSSMCRPWVLSRQLTSRVGIVGEPVDAVTHIPDPDLVDPAAEVGGRGHVGADGDHMPRGIRRHPQQIEEEPAEGLLGGRAGAMGAAGLGGEGRRRSRLHLRPAQALGRRGAQATGAGVGLEPAPRIVGVGAQLNGELPPLVGREQRRVVPRMALCCQPPGLDGVGEDHGRPVDDRVGLPIGVQQRRQVVAAQVADRASQLVVGETRDQPGDLMPCLRRSRAVPRADAPGWRAAVADTPRWSSSRSGGAATLPPAG